jgi:hypothetical protein
MKEANGAYDVPAIWKEQKLFKKWCEEPQRRKGLAFFLSLKIMAKTVGDMILDIFSNLSASEKADIAIQRFFHYFDARDTEIVVEDPQRIVFKRYLKTKQLMKIKDTGKNVNVKLINL